MIPLPILQTGYAYYSCCGKIICAGCEYAPLYDNEGNVIEEKGCPFCRTPPPTSEEKPERILKRVEVDDVEAMLILGRCYLTGSVGWPSFGLPQDIKKGLELLHRSGELGSARAYCDIGSAYMYGRGGVEIDKKKAMYYYELAAIGGHLLGRLGIAGHEEKAGNKDRALKHS